jgi:glucose/arabinose dehydrogenase
MQSFISFCIILVILFPACGVKDTKSANDSPSISEAEIDSPGVVSMTPKENLGLQPTTLSVADKFRVGRFTTSRTLNLPPGFHVNVFAAELGDARFIAISPQGILYVTAMDAGKVLALPDRNGDGVTDTIITVASNMRSPHGIAFYQNVLYVAETHRVVRLLDTNGDLVADKTEVIISNLPSGGGHFTRTILFDETAQKLYVSVGSTCNACDDDPRRACILQFHTDGSGERLFASGLRNSVGLAWHPISHELWATDNGIDLLGDDLPPEEVNVVRDGKHYGWPFAYSNQVPNPSFPPRDAAFLKRVQKPAAQLQAHSAPLGIHFYTKTQFPSDYRNAAFVAFHGSWNRSKRTGYKVVRLRIGADGKNGKVSDFLSGFLDDASQSVWGRPVDVISDAQGNLYVSDDYNDAIFRIQYSP